MGTERLDRPFANGTEGEAWLSAWCANCIHDHTPNHGPDGVIGPGCPHITDSLAGRTPLIWQPYEPDWWHKLPTGITCRAFEPCTCDAEWDDSVAKARGQDPTRGLRMPT